MKKLSFFLMAMLLTIGAGNGRAETVDVYKETFGSTTSNTVFTQYSGYTATVGMFVENSSVQSHYSGDGKVGKNSLSAANLSSGYTDASGLSGCFHSGIASTQSTIIQISGINIENYTDLVLSFGALGGSTSHKIDVTYSIDNGTEKSLISSGSITNANWKLLSANLTETGKSLTLSFKHKPTKAWTIRLDDIKITGTVSTSDDGTETIDAPEFSVTEANFTEAFTLNITSAEGTTLKYTTDNTDPATSATAVVVNTNTASVAIPAKSTAVKAVAIKGELVSNVKSMTFCYVNSEATAYTVTEALAIYNEGLGLSNKLYIKGSVKSIEELNTEYGNATYTITDGDNDLYIYRGKNFGGEKFTSVDQLFVGDDLVLYGQLASYNGNPQVAANSEIISRESKTKSIVADDLVFDAIAFGAEVEAQTLTVVGANLTEEIVVALDNEKFSATPATLPVAGGDLTITPTTDLAVGEHTATLTLTSGDVTKEVALSILIKDVYTITWSVNGEPSTTSVVEGDKLVLPAAPEAPEACSEKVFVGWTAAEEVNADGSDIEWVTATTVPTDDATYYAVFALASGEGGVNEVVDVLNNALTGISGTSYASWSGKTATSDAVYAGQSAGDKESIQLRSKNNNSGIITTLSGGKLAKVVVTWQGETATGRTLDVYGSNTAYSQATDLYNNTTQGEKLGSIICGTSTELTVNGDYTHVGLRSNDGAMYLTSVEITWTTGASATYTDYSTTCEEVVDPETPTSVDNIEVSASAVKAIENGQLIVIKNGVKYNALGQEIK